MWHVVRVLDQQQRLFWPHKFQTNLNNTILMLETFSGEVFGVDKLRGHQKNALEGVSIHNSMTPNCSSSHGQVVGKATSQDLSAL
jgi:hypothetical protein